MICHRHLLIKKLIVPAALFSACVAPPTAAAGIEIDADFPGGNVRIVRRTGDTFTLAPDLRDIQEGLWWFYFNFRLRAPAAQPVSIVFEGTNPLGVRGPAMSADGGRTWKWLGADAVKASEVDGVPRWSFQAMVPPGAEEARFAFAPPYQESHLREWLDRHRNGAALHVSELCRSHKGRGVELIRAGCLDDAKASGVVLLTSRHHACESIATYALEGILTAALADDDLGRRWRERWQIVAMPFADKDGVEEGDQGKNRAPHDHNRDYNATPLYPEVASWMRLGESLKPRVVLSLDMHCPHIRGQWNDRAYIVGGSTPAFVERERAFVQAIERAGLGPIPFNAADCYLPFGTAWNQTGNYAAGRASGAWARDTFPNARFCGTIEITYADALGVEMNAETARAFGRDLARAILHHLEP
jgi:hypothetical protein